jgi:lipoprotein-anchoring transpeptidase ErfK/SrfK
MFRALTHSLIVGSALLMAAPTTSVAAPGSAEPGERRVGDDGLKLAQARDIEVYYDRQGNRVIVDAYSGEVLAVQPQRTSRAAQRRMERARELGRRDRGDLQAYDDYVDYERPRRRDADRVYDGTVDMWGDPAVPDYTNPEYDRAYEERDDFQGRDYSGQEFPEPPMSPPSTVRNEPVQRAPLDGGYEPAPREQTAATQPSIDEPSTTGSTSRADPNAPVAAPMDPSKPPALNFTAREEVAQIQVLLDRAGASPGVIDGKFGSNVDKAFEAYRMLTGTNLKSTDTADIKAALLAGGGPAFMDYEITPEDAAGPFVAAVPDDYSQKAQLAHMSYTSVTEKLAERFHMDEGYLKALNPDANFNRPGTIVRVANTGANVTTKVARIEADKGRKQVRAYDANGKLVVAYPATIGSSATPSPTGTHTVERVAFNPNYTYNPKINFKQGDNDKVLTIPPGPNGPVGSIWIALSKPTYGIHGTPEPSKIGKTESNGCIRLTNWDAEELARIVSPGVTVEFLE